MTDELLPCPLPWCQGEAFLTGASVWGNVECSLCGCEGPARKTEAESIAAWNTRTPDRAAIVAETEAAIVAWMRGRAHRATNTAFSPVAQWIADAIERGEYKEPRT